MHKFNVTLTVLIIFLAVYSQSVIAQPPNITSDCTYILMDLKAGQVIAEQDADKKMRPASTTKIMTAILALEYGKLDQVMNVSKDAVYDIGDGGSNIGILPGESNLTLENLLNVMLVKSANETANIIAENIGGTRSAFVDMMNEKAAELGAVNTNFVNPCGKDDAKEDANHLSTAKDMAIIARYAMNIPKFREIVSKEYYKDMPATNDHQVWDPLRNTNKLLWPVNSYPYVLDNIKYTYTVNGIKTGYTSAAENNLIVSAENDEGMELLAVIMHSPGSASVFSSAKKLLRYGFEHYSLQKIADANQIIKNIEVEDAKDNDSLDLVTSTEFKCSLPVGIDNPDIVTRENIIQPVKAPIHKGDVLGYIEYERNGIQLGKVDIIASKDIQKATEKATEKVTDGTVKEKSQSRFYYISIITFVVALCCFLLLRIALRRMLRRINKRRYFKL